LRGDARNLQDIEKSVIGQDIIVNIIAPKLGDKKLRYQPNSHPKHC